MMVAYVTYAWVPLLAQDPVFSQFYGAPLQLNAAFAGVSAAPSVHLNYRNQWPGLNQAYQTYAASYDQFFPDMNSGFGGYLLADDAGNGILKTFKIAGIYAYRLQLNRGLYLKGGIEAGVVQSRLDWSKLLFPDQLDLESGAITPGGTPIPSGEDEPENLNQTYLDLGFGALLYSPQFYVGINLKHLNTPNPNFLNVNDNLYSGIPVQINAHAGTEIRFLRGNKRNGGAFLTPNLMFVRQGAFTQINVGTFVRYQAVSVGAWIRHTNNNTDALIGAIGLRSGIFRVTYSYDVTISSLSTRSGGSHEVGISILFDDGKEESIYNDCFNIFR